MLRWMLAAAAGCLVLACNVQSEQVEKKAVKSGINVDYFDTTVKPQDDFYRYANGKWLDTVEIPADKSMYSSFTELSDMNEERLKGIIEGAAKVENAAAGTPVQQLGDFYRAYMDIARLDELGYSPLKENLAKIDAAKSAEDLQAVMAQLARMGVNIPARVSVGVDAKDATRYAVYVSQSGISLPDRDYYLADSEKMASIREAFKAHLAKIFTLIGAKDAAVSAQAVLDLETKLAELQWTRVESRNRDKTYNKFSHDALSKEAPGFPWGTYLASLDAGEGELIVRQPSFVTGFAKLFPETSVDTWKTYFTWHLVNTFAGVLSTEFQEADFEFYGKTLSGTPEQRPRWKRAVSASNGILGEIVGKIYVEKYFKPEAKERMRELVGNLKVAFGARLDQLDWMSDETKKEAHKKLGKFNAKIGYPDKWRDFSSLKITSDDLFGNFKRSRLQEFDRDMKRLGGPVDKDEWFMTPQTVNAYYSSTHNEIVFPAAILQPPFFDLEADMAANYGGIGAVIGHEITHGFDDQGRKSDGDGNLRDWWSEEDGTEFDKRAQMMVDQYGSYKPLEDMPVNGKLTLGENIADLGGLTVAYHAYIHSLKGEPSPKIDGLTGEQRIFVAWAQVWRRKYREEALRQRLATDSHSPGRYRAIGPISNMPEFFEAFGVKEGDAMRRNEADLIKIW